MTLMPPEQHNYGSGLMAGRDINIKTISKKAENLLDSSPRTHRSWRTSSGRHSRRA